MGISDAHDWRAGAVKPLILLRHQGTDVPRSPNGVTTFARINLHARDESEMLVAVPAVEGWAEVRVPPG